MNAWAFSNTLRQLDNNALDDDLIDEKICAGGVEENVDATCDVILHVKMNTMMQLKFVQNQHFLLGSDVDRNCPDNSWRIELIFDQINL